MASDKSDKDANWLRFEEELAYSTYNELNGVSTKISTAERLASWYILFMVAYIKHN